MYIYQTQIDGICTQNTPTHTDTTDRLLSLMMQKHGIRVFQTQVRTKPEPCLTHSFI